ncbi:MAG: uncharacterized protein JWM59_189 [Verrucomicrobiales bacterium]|nr:uncharacterized protein [Verrucomicrobiales bacterium]
MAWHYLRAAVFQRWRLPVVGDVPVNLGMLGLFAVLGLDNPAFWAVGGGVEAMWLVLTAGRTGYRRQVDAHHRRLAWKKVEERRLALFSRLPPEAAQRHQRLRAACQELTGAAAGGDPESVAEVFTWLHLKLLLAREALAAGRPGEPDHADEDLHRLQARAALDVADPTAARTAQQALSLLESRHRHAGETRERLAHIDAQLEAIEAEITAARQRHLRDRTPFDFRHTLSLARDRLHEDLSGLEGDRPVAEVEALLTRLSEGGQGG